MLYRIKKTPVIHFAVIDEDGNDCCSEDGSTFFETYTEAEELVKKLDSQMKYKSISAMDRHDNVDNICDELNGSHAQGFLETTYDRLERFFGEPMESDGYKIDAEWVLKFDDGKIATISNWKDGYNYLGRYGKEVEDITEWHIGGHDSVVVDRIKKILD